MTWKFCCVKNYNVECGGKSNATKIQGDAGTLNATFSDAANKTHNKVCKKSEKNMDGFSF